jgi:hypothetical protein
MCDIYDFSAFYLFLGSFLIIAVGYVPGGYLGRISGGVGRLVSGMRWVLAGTLYPYCYVHFAVFWSLRSL